MARRRNTNNKGETRTSFTFPSLHQEVAEAISSTIGSTWYCEGSRNREILKNHSTHVMGLFKCTNKACETSGWSSKKVAILIRGYRNNGYNAVVYNQRCKACNNLGTMDLDEDSYIDRVTYRIQKWAGVPMEEQSYTSKGGVPHERRFCEGCKRGVCRQTYKFDSY